MDVSHFSTDINDCNPHPWYVPFPASYSYVLFCYPSLSYFPHRHITESLRDGGVVGGGQLRAVEVLLKSNLKEASLRAGGWDIE